MLAQVGIYFPLYDALVQHLSHTRIDGYAPLVAGGTARTIAVLCTSPLELVRTRMQVMQTSWQRCSQFLLDRADIRVLPRRRM